MTATAARAQLQAAQATALPQVAVYPLPPMSLAGPSVVIEPDGWVLMNGAQVIYRARVHVIHNAPDTTTALGDLEGMAATSWLATLAAGWSPGDMGGPEAVTYADQPFMSMTYTAQRLVTLGS